MAAMLITAGYGEVVDFQWNGGNVQVSLNAGGTWTNCFSLAAESGLEALEFNLASGAWAWAVLYQDGTGVVHMQTSTNRGTTWSLLY
jgi:hypothetical protein